MYLFDLVPPMQNKVILFTKYPSRRSILLDSNDVADLEQPLEELLQLIVRSDAEIIVNSVLGCIRT